MASFIELPFKLMGNLYGSLKEVPLPLLLLGLVTTALSTVAFVRPPYSPSYEFTANLISRFTPSSS
jgi:hypothetical protein